MGDAPFYEGRLGLQQRVLPAYRVPFFERLALACRKGLGIFTGRPRPREVIQSADHLLQGAQHVPGRNVHLFGGRLYVCLQPGITRWLATWNPDALILEANPRYFSNLTAIAWMHRRGRPVIGWGLGVAAGRGVLRSLRLALLGRFDGMIAYSSLGAQQFRELGFASSRVFVAYNAVSPRPAPLAARPERPEHRRRILFVGRLERRKRVDLLVRACAAVRPLPEVWIVGDGPSRRELEDLARDLLPGARFLGARFGTELEEVFQQVDVFVLPGTGGLAVQEAMAHGLPVIVAAGDGTQNDLVAEDNGWLVPPDDLGALADAIGHALGDPERLRRMGAASHALATERFNIEAMTRVFVTALNAVARGGG